MKRLFLYFAAAAMLFCGAFAPQHSAAQSNEELDLYTDALKQYLIYGDTVKARALINQVLESDSTYAPAHLLLSRIESDTEKAWAAAERALSSDSTDFHMLQNAAEKSWQAYKYERAKQHLTHLLPHSQNPDHFRLLAILHNIKKERTEAIAVLDSAEVRFGKDSYLSRVRQQIYLDGGESQKAIKSALESVEEAPYEPMNHIALADVYATIGADSLADISYNNAIRLDNTDPTSWFEYAGFLDNRKRYTELLLVWRNVIELENVPLTTKVSIVESVTTTRRDFYRKNFLLIGPIVTRMYELYPTNSKVVDLYTTHLIASNRVEEALVMIKKGVVENKPTLEQLTRIIEIEDYVGRKDSVELYTNRGIELYPTHANFWTLKAWLATQRNDHEGAIQTLKAALEYAEDSEACSSIWGSIGDQYYELGSIKKSYSAYNKALSYNLNNAIVLNNYAYHLSIIGKSLDQALTMAKRANELSPNNATYLDTLAWVYYKLGQYEEAKKVMQLAIAFDKNKSHDLALHYGDILDALGNSFMAQTYWRKALELGANAEEIESRLKSQKERENAKKGGE